MSDIGKTKEENLDIKQLQQEVERLRKENANLRSIFEVPVSDKKLPAEVSQPSLPLAIQPPITSRSSIQEKIVLFRSLFKGREDVYAQFWMNERTGKKGYSPACKEPWTSGKTKIKNYLPLTDQTIHDHLSGTKTIGLFPLLTDNNCWFLACDFDKQGWLLDAMAYLHICKRYNIPAYLERSRSGNGGHVWIFVSSPVSATSSRQLGMRLIRETMNIRADLDLGSYDRFFPNQDFMPKGGLGNLIAVPLQKKCRTLGNTEFLDPDDSEFRPYPDQWAFLSTIQKISPAQLEALLKIIPPLTVGSECISSISPQIRQQFPAPKKIHCILDSTISIEKSGIPPWLLSQIKHLASLHHPEFYKRQKLRLTTFQIPRFIKCFEENVSHIHLPRGTFEELRRIVKDADSELSVTDTRPVPKILSLKFTGTLTALQEKAVESVLLDDMGILVAPPGSGKTVMGCFVGAKRNVPTLILAHRKPILEQWRKQIVELLGIPSKQIGQVGGGRNRQSGIVDLGMIQSLKRFEDLRTFFSNYGLIVVDECHHLPAFSFENAVKKAPSRYILGLTATPYRRDGLQNIITMQCGPIRHKMENPESDISRNLIVRETSFSYPIEGEVQLQYIFRAMIKDESRNSLIQEDVSKALDQGRNCLILTDWKEHCQILADSLTQNGVKSFILNGTLGKKERFAIMKSIGEELSSKNRLLVIATGQFLGEGFDCPQIDTIFLAFPISFKGKLIQYVGRALREHEGKSNVVVYDYADAQVPVLKNMHMRRLKTFKVLDFM